MIGALCSENRILIEFSNEQIANPEVPATNTYMTKAQLRKLFRQKRSELTHSEIDKLNDLILLQFQKIPLSDLHLVHSFISSERHKEPDTSLILRFLKFRFPEIRIAAPVVDAASPVMAHYLLTDESLLEKNEYGIDEPVSGELVYPQDIDLVIIPLLAFDEEGYRVGYGKGYYDRFLLDCRADVIKVGLSFFDPMQKVDDRNEYDIPLDYCCTPESLYIWRHD